MLLAEQVQAMSGRLGTILTVYVNTGNQNLSRHPLIPAHQAWFRKEAARVSEGLQNAERKQFLRESSRVEKFLETRRPEEKALLIFAGKKAWTVIPLQIGVENELRWGKPALGQSFQLLNEHPSLGVVAVDHHAARFFLYRLGEINLVKEKAFVLDKSEWKQKELGHVTGESVQKTRGSNRDVFERRVEAQYERLCHETAEEVIRLTKKHELAGLFLIGPIRLVNPLQARLGQPYRNIVVCIAEDLGKFSPRQILERMEPYVREFEQKRQRALVVQLLFEEGKFRTNPDEILAQMQNGAIHTLLVATDMDLQLHQCAKCGIASRSADKTCARCGGELRNLSLIELLPELAFTRDIKVEFVSGEAARELAKIGGIGGWPREAHVRAVG